MLNPTFHIKQGLIQEERPSESLSVLVYLGIVAIQRNWAQKPQGCRYTKSHP